MRPANASPELLEWSRIVSAIAAHTQTPMGKRRALALRPDLTGEAVRARLALGRAAYRCKERGDPLPIRECADTEPALVRLAASASLTGLELRALAVVAGMSQTLRRTFQRQREGTPDADLLALHAHLDAGPGGDEVREAVLRAIRPDGSLEDEASPALREARANAHRERDRLMGALTRVQAEYASCLQEAFITEREGRYVLPVRSDAHDRFPGIIHGTSGSGATLFIEPEVVVNLGNRVKMLTAKVEDEERRVLDELTRRAAQALPLLERAAQVVTEADVLVAITRWASDLRLCYVEVSEQPSSALRGLRHALLVSDRVGQPDAPAVVPSDVELRAGQALVISGPNAGGKSVLLKAMGLAALLTRAGLPVPCTADATVYPYDVLADIGDGQSIGNNLSTFSSHLARMATLVEVANRDSLILLDEVCSGTEPREGEVLATALLEALVARGATVVVTTHYDALKLRALHDARFRNSSMTTEPEGHAPTFNLVLDLPGRAWALELAAREPALRAVTERARELLREDPSRGARLDEALDGLATLRARWQAELAAVQAERQRVEANEAAREAEVAALRARGAKQATRELTEVFGALARVQAELGALSTRASATDATARLQELRQTFTHASEGAREAERMLRKPLSGALASGTRVYVASLGAVAVVESERDDIVRLRFGSLSVSAPRAELFAPSDADVTREPSSRSIVGASRDPRSAAKLPASPPSPAPAPEDLQEEVPLPSRDNTLDLRGEPLAELTASWSAFRAHATGADLSHVYVLHGFGARRERLRDLLRHDARVAFYRAADAADGGDGTTLVRLRASSR